jgi:hypothetical protein
VALVAAQRAAGAQHRLLDDVLGVLGGAAEHAPGVAQQRGVVAREDLGERRVVAAPVGRDERLVVDRARALLKHDRGSWRKPIRRSRRG